MAASAAREQVAGDERTALCALVGGDDLELMYRVVHALEARGVEAFVMGDPAISARSRKPTTPSVVVRRRDLVYARWVAWAAGVDAWPE
jgi:hypothetical protein